MPPQPRTICQGQLGLQKKSGAEVKYFVLTEEYFEYYKAAEDATAGNKPRGRLLLSDVKSFEATGQTLMLNMQGQILRLSVPEGESAEPWVTAFRSVLKCDMKVSAPPSEEPPRASASTGSAAGETDAVSQPDVVPPRASGSKASPVVESSPAPGVVPPRASGSNASPVVESSPAPRNMSLGPDLVHAGYLKLCRKGVITKRYFVLLKEHFRYFETQEDAEAVKAPRGNIQLKDIKEFEDTSIGFAVMLSIDNKRLEFGTDGDKDQKAWRDAWKSLLLERLGSNFKVMEVTGNPGPADSEATTPRSASPTQPASPVQPSSHRKLSTTSSVYSASSAGKEKVIFCEGQMEIVKKKGDESRYFVLCDDHVEYYSVKTDYDKGDAPRGYMSHDDLQQVELENDNILSMMVANRKFSLRTQSHEDALRWGKAWEKVLEIVNKEREKNLQVRWSSSFNVVAKDDFKGNRESTVGNQELNEAVVPRTSASNAASVATATAVTRASGNAASAAAAAAVSRASAASATEGRGGSPRQSSRSSARERSSSRDRSPRISQHADPHVATRPSLPPVAGPPLCKGIFKVEFKGNKHGFSERLFELYEDRLRYYRGTHPGAASSIDGEVMVGDIKELEKLPHDAGFRLEAGTGAKLDIFGPQQGKLMDWQIAFDRVMGRGAPAEAETSESGLAAKIVFGKLDRDKLDLPMLLSGACDGADETFGEMAMQHKHRLVHFLGPGDEEWASAKAKEKQSHAFQHVKAELLQDKVVSEAFDRAGESRVLGSQRTPDWRARVAEMASRRNFLQVRCADVVYVVGWRLQEGKDQFFGRSDIDPRETPILDVGGGTGWACQWYVDRFAAGGEDPSQCKLFFFDDAGPPWARKDPATEGKWSRWNPTSQKWEPLEDPPTPSGLYAGIGETRLSSRAENAIHGLFRSEPRLSAVSGPPAQSIVGGVPRSSASAGSAISSPSRGSDLQKRASDDKSLVTRKLSREEAKVICGSLYRTISDQFTEGTQRQSKPVPPESAKETKKQATASTMEKSDSKPSLWKDKEDPTTNPVYMEWLASLKERPVHQGFLGFQLDGRLCMKWSVLFPDRLDSWDKPLDCVKPRSPPYTIRVSDINSMESIDSGMILHCRVLAHVHTAKKKLGVHVPGSAKEQHAWSVAFLSIIDKFGTAPGIAEGRRSSSASKISNGSQQITLRDFARNDCLSSLNSKRAVSRDFVPRCARVTKPQVNNSEDGKRRASWAGQETVSQNINARKESMRLGIHMIPDSHAIKSSNKGIIINTHGLGLSAHESVSRAGWVRGKDSSDDKASKMASPRLQPVPSHLRTTNGYCAPLKTHGEVKDKVFVHVTSAPIFRARSPSVDHIAGKVTGIHDRVLPPNDRGECPWQKVNLSKDSPSIITPRTNQQVASKIAGRQMTLASSGGRPQPHLDSLVRFAISSTVLQASSISQGPAPGFDKDRMRIQTFST
eukprot:CAMPEP_0115488108 /NCGR_PEP_ID=MMETSP0271-20121206/61302_1 /TAXON_ID=71861 /ORGANISM="Scrippsiella trochoidea, Strain CCMP3099" /LENGTH=1459 /DNA_ID=CAMNT_0002916181 /DNA_START=44 /DNA_END=4424 /DNA_ORIENTATION=-